ncbi:MAG: pyridoxal phosphate-dependent aminotransferase [Oscillospiraceae bacterium]|nr:pyridoxal phosphate-dependent aminotransferase [Oscillospiraceae bacterium]
MIDYSKYLNKRIKDIPLSPIEEISILAAQEKDCIVLGVGEPDFRTPWRIREAGIQALEKGKTWYSPGLGLQPLKKAICDYQKRRFKLDYKPEEVMVTVGGSEGIDMLFRVMLEEGDEVILPTPCYVSYDPIAKLCGAKVVEVELKMEDNFRLTAEALKKAITPKSKILVLPFPGNPTGAIMEEEDLLEIADVIRDTEIFVMTDEIYAELTYGQYHHVSFASIPGMKERTIVINGFSKAYAMTGWRLGYALGPKPIIDAMATLHQVAVICAPTTSQYAAVVAMNECDEEIDTMRHSYDMRRRFLINELNSIGIPCYNAQGAFYVFADIRGTGMTSREFCINLLKQSKVAVIPGNAFGNAGEGFIRISYSYSLDHLMEATKRIGEFMESLKE